MVIWIIGKSGSGKTFFANKINIFLSKKKIKVFWLDGDDFRKYISNDLGYSISDRKENSLRIIKFCKYLESKGYLVLCSFLSIFFHLLHHWIESCIIASFDRMMI